MVETMSYEALQQRIKDLEGSSKNLAFRNKQLASLIDNSQLGIVVLDKEMRIVECNESFERLFQYGLEEMEGMSLDGLIVGQDQTEEAISHSTTTLTGKPIQGS